MTLTLDDVRNMKFRIARRAGYEVMDVDQFVDQVEEAFAQMSEENGMLRQQVDALKSSPAPAAPLTPPQGQAPPSSNQEPQPRSDAQAGGERLIVTTSDQASQAAHRLVQMAEKVVTEAEGDAEKIREDARREAHQITTDARTRAERSESEARVLAERVSSEAQGLANRVSSEAKGRADQLDRDLLSRRTELFSRLETEQGQLNDSVQKLRDFETTYRTNITTHLKGQLSSLDQTAFEPEQRPAGLPSANRQGQGQNGPAQNGPAQNGPAQNGPAQNGPQAQSPTDEDDDDQTVRLTSTPRLDALLGDNRS